MFLFTCLECTDSFVYWIGKYKKIKIKNDPLKNQKLEAEVKNLKEEKEILQKELESKDRKIKALEDSVSSLQKMNEHLATETEADEKNLTKEKYILQQELDSKNRKIQALKLNQHYLSLKTCHSQKI